jgi:hypothetical protein
MTGVWRMSNDLLPVAEHTDVRPSERGWAAQQISLVVPPFSSPRPTRRHPLRQTWGER